MSFLLSLFFVGLVSAKDFISCEPLLVKPESRFLSMTEKVIQVPLEFEPIAQLRQAVERRIGRQLLSRGEAHITVIKPQELSFLEGVLSRSDLEKLIASFELHPEKLNAICVGMGEARLGGKRESTYFVVLEAPELFSFRRQVATEVANRSLKTRGSRRSTFDAADFYPHITLGFSSRDLHEQHGVVKNVKSCLYPIKIL